MRDLPFHIVMLLTVVASFFVTGGMIYSVEQSRVREIPAVHVSVNVADSTNIPEMSVHIDRMGTGVYNVWTIREKRWYGRTVDTDVEALQTAMRILRSDFTTP